MALESTCFACLLQSELFSWFPFTTIFVRWGSVPSHSLKSSMSRFFPKCVKSPVDQEVGIRHSHASVLAMRVAYAGHSHRAELMSGHVLIARCPF